MNFKSIDLASKNLQLTGSITGKISQLSEVQALVQSPVKIESEKIIQIESEIFNKIKMQDCRFELVGNSKSNGPGFFDSLLEIKGLTHEVSKEIRMFINKKEKYC